jgi:hypothetical protein
VAVIQGHKKCSQCGRKTLHARSTFGDGAGCVLSVLTLGIFVPIWIVIKVAEAMLVPWRCQVCGKSRRT